ncbi:hypothetical protein [Streptomyces sp. NPDC029526]|uniref:hypothetical protein n=1 Tax=Streptomyces sp. NPDC029526 TaxID=3155728 RepID=UPI0033F671B3
MKREELLAEARKHVWAAWQLSAEELASQAVATLHGMGMLVPEGGAQELEKLARQVVALQDEVARAVRVAAGAVRERDLMRERVSEPFGCAHCGAAKRVHGRRYIGGVGMHGWERPSDEQVKARMLARRVASMALPSNLSLWEESAATKALRARVTELEAQRETLVARLKRGQEWQPGRTPALVSQDYLSQDELRAIFGIPLVAPWDDTEDPWHPCGCPKRFDRHADGCSATPGGGV